MNKTKIVCTIGPKTSSPEAIQSLIDSGMNIARLNASHNSLDWHLETINTIREVDPLISILVDLPGRKIRTASLSEFPFEEKQELIITTNPEYTGTEKILITYLNLHEDLKPGDILLVDDGTLKFEVTEICDRDITIRAFNNGIIKRAKGINIPYIQVNSPLITDRDIEVIEMCKFANVDFIGVSFVENDKHIAEVMQHLQDTSIAVVAKVENQFAINNLRAILEKSFAILIDRGDLSAETKMTNIAILQKKILKEANELGIPVIVATEMLHTMIENPVPTKAEVNDITNSALDGGSAMMLSGETAVGNYPFIACKTMAKVIKAAENYAPEQSNNHTVMSVRNIPNVIGKCIYEAGKNLPITKIVCLTYTGYAVKMIARYRLTQPIIVVTDTIEKARKFNLFFGVQSVVLDIQFTPQSSEHIINALRTLHNKNYISDEDMILVTAVRYPSPDRGTKMNYLEIHHVRDLKETFNWEESHTSNTD